MYHIGSLRKLWIKSLEMIFQRQIIKYWIQIGNQSFLFNPKDIIRVYADGSYSYLVTTNNSFLISHNLFYMEKILSGWGFIRISRSHIINVIHIQRIVKGHPSLVLMDDGTEIVIPRRESSRMIRKLEETF